MNEGAAGILLVKDLIGKQPGELKKLLSSHRIRPARDGSILVGAGDSYAASLCVSNLSSFRLLAVDPRSLNQAPEMARGRDVYIVSVTGRTSANLEVARRLRGVCRHTFGITASTDSPLAKDVDEVIRIPLTSRGKAPGTLSFSLSLLILLLLQCPKRAWDFRGAFDASRRAAEKVMLSQTGVTYFLGNHAANGVAVYAAAKVYEFLGWRSHPELLEEFSHMELFSLTRDDTVNIFSCFDDGNTGKKLKALLRRHRYRCELIDSWGESDVEKLFHSVFTVQLAALRSAELLGLMRPHFLDAKTQLETSDAMIYD